MATVHRAEARGIAGFKRTVALKRLMPHLALEPGVVKSFVHEARLASLLHHHNIAQTLDLGRVGDTYFIAMEYVPGPTLAQIMAQSDVVGVGAMPLPVVLSIIAQICDGLDYAHNLRDETDQLLGIIHRDVSPANVIVSNTGCVKLIDFGIAKVTSSREAQTQVGTIKGKFAYIAPEYLEGQLDLRADLFAIGVIAHELLAGKPLFQTNNDLETVNRLREMPIQPPSRWNREVTRDLDDIVLTALQRDPARRWQSASAMRAAVTNLMRDLGQVAGNQQVFEWVEWAFSQKPKPEDPKLVRVIDALDDGSSAQTVLSRAQQRELDEASRRTLPMPTVAPGGGRASIGGERASIGDGRASIGGERASIGGERASIGGERASIGGERASIGGERRKSAITAPQRPRRRAALMSASASVSAASVSASEEASPRGAARAKTPSATGSALPKPAAGPIGSAPPRSAPREAVAAPRSAPREAVAPSASALPRSAPREAISVAAIPATGSRRDKRPSDGAAPAVARLAGVVAGPMVGISSGITLVAPRRPRARRSWIWLVLIVMAAAVAGVAATQFLGLAIDF